VKQMIRNRIARTAAIAALALTLVGAGAQPAGAASGVSYCFVHSNGSAATTGYSYTQSFTRTYLLGWENGGWNRVLAIGDTGKDGCGTFTISGDARNYYVRVLYYGTVAYGSQWAGATPHYALPGNLHAHLGTGTVLAY
jgi:hypothetical protein